MQINKPHDYVEAMRKVGVVVDHVEREKLIWSPRFTASAPHAWLRAQLLDVTQRL